MYVHNQSMLLMHSGSVSWRMKKQVKYGGRKRVQRKNSEESSNTVVHKAEAISQVFITATKEGPDYICTCCHRLMYRKTVIEFNISKYPKAPEEFVSMSVRTSAKD